MGNGYLEHLTDADLRALARPAGIDPNRAIKLRRHPAAVVRLFDNRELFDQVYGQDPKRLVGVSPFFAFLVAVHRAVAELADANFVAERSAPRQQVPLFDTPRLRDFLSDPARRLFLAELLTSFVKVASGRYRTRTTRGWRSERFSELDPVRMAQFVEQTPAAYRPGYYRRLGDVSLFLTGVFPDYVQTRAFGPFDVDRLLRAAGLAPDADDLADSPPIQLLERLGQRWYRQASQTAPVQTIQLAVVSQVAGRFQDARRVLNHIADQYLNRVGNPWFGVQGA